MFRVTAEFELPLFRHAEFPDYRDEACSTTAEIALKCVMLSLQTVKELMRVNFLRIRKFVLPVCIFIFKERFLFFRQIL